MSDLGEAPGAILGLVVGGIILISFGKELESTSYINLEFWGVVYVIAAIVLAIVVVVAGVSALLRGL